MTLGDMMALDRLLKSEGADIAVRIVNNNGRKALVPALINHNLINSYKLELDERFYEIVNNYFAAKGIRLQWNSDRSAAWEV